MSVSDAVEALRSDFKAFSENIISVVKSQNELLEKLSLENAKFSTGLFEILNGQTKILANIEKSMTKPEPSTATVVNDSSSAAALVLPKTSALIKTEKSKERGNQNNNLKMTECSTIIQFENPMYSHEQKARSQGYSIRMRMGRHFQPLSCSMVFELGPPIDKINLNMTWNGSRYLGKNFKASVTTGSNIGRRDFLFHLTFMNDETLTNVKKWFYISTRNGISAHAEPVHATSHHDGSETFLNAEEHTSLSYAENITILVKMTMMHCDLQDTSPRPDSASMIQRQTQVTRSSPEERMAKLYKLRNQLSLEAKLKVIQGCSCSISVYEDILKDCSPMFKLLFDDDPSTTHANKPPNMQFSYVSRDSLQAFHNWIYGADDGIWLKNVKVNLELLKFAYECMIGELFQICIDNLINTPDENYTIEWVIEAGKIAEVYNLPRVQDRVFEWIKSKSGVSDGCLRWVDN